MDGVYVCRPCVFLSGIFAHGSGKDASGEYLARFVHFRETATAESKHHYALPPYTRNDNDTDRGGK